MSNPDPLFEGPEKNLTDKRYESCGNGHKLVDNDGHFDGDVQCGASKEPMFCGERLCPLDAWDIPDEDDNTITFEEEHGERDPQEGTHG